MLPPSETKNKITERIILDIALIVSILFFPWWVFFVLSFIGGVTTKNYFESILGGFIMDALYGTTTTAFHGFYLYFTLGSFGMVILSEWCKKKIRFLSE